MENITVDAAIKRGQWLLFWCPMLVLLGTTGLLVFVFLYLMAGDVWWINALCTALIFLLPGALSLYLCFLMAPRWRIWALSNVRNVHELKQRALLSKLYPREDSFMWRFEIINEEQKRQLEELEQKFSRQDIFVDDFNIPFETSYAYSKVENVLYLLFTMGAAFLVVAFLWRREYLLSIPLLLGGIAFGKMAYTRMSKAGPVLRISNDGITTIENGFHPWRDISNEQIFWVSAGQASYYGISFEINGQLVKMSLKELTGLSSWKIDHVLRTCRGRYDATRCK
jgi:hypothetical protein